MNSPKKYIDFIWNNLKIQISRQLRVSCCRHKQEVD